ncbi:hypothetical protein H5410_005943 [Solanum commersonii]|uniref:Uncharacterized protein n=1 Tax=Solanum commersonii TaxID=4109 RepID=A0A9J6A800_SOLCO|nr:hypothetical protein H5410_005943 [Solanum commersonii]
MGIYYYKDEFTCYMYKECSNLLMLCLWVAIRWKRKVETNLLKLVHGLQYLNLIEESKFEDENAYYVIIADRLGRSSLVQII